MPDVWRVYRIKNCRHTHPPKDKFAIIVCVDSDCMGFLVNSEISKFTANKPDLLQCQVPLKKEKFHFLFYDSYLDCAQLYPFSEDELNIGLEIIDDNTKEEIKKSVLKAKTIAKRHVKLIMAN
jgi:hypothetical protein